jgi:ElaB/YqjD/DUF883 family membrane-anchored ribosome-binding protein
MTSQTSGTTERFAGAVPEFDVQAHEKKTMLDKAEYVREKAEGLYRKNKDRMVEMEADFEDYVKDHPVKSVLVAAGVGTGIGVLLGVLLGRRG